MRGATALHAAAQHGHTPLVRWLLVNGARPSLDVKNAMGCTPLDVAHAFGPFPDTAAVLIQASTGAEFDERYVILADGRLSLKTGTTRRASSGRLINIETGPEGP